MESYNEQQLEAIESEERTIVCLAAAGCGKTKTLLGRAERLIKQGVDPKSILCITFTNAAAFEMKERYKQIPGLDLSQGTPEFRTFHSFCYSLIVKDPAVRERIGYSKIPELCDDNTFKEIKTKVKLAIGCKLTDAQLDNDVPLSRTQQEEKKLFQKALIKEIKKENVITFDIMCYNVCELFTRGEECVDKYKQKYKYLMCDEMQDTDPKQFKFIASFPETTHFFMVGDVLQAIYAFRGCTNEFIKQLTVDPNWKVIKMFENYRSTRQICEFANKFSTYSRDEYRIEMHGQRDGEEPEVIYGSNSSYDYPVDRQHLKILVEKLQERKCESAILCRTNRECNAVKGALSSAGIEYTARSKSSDVLNILHSALSNEYMLGWLSTKLEAREYGDYIRLAAQDSNPDIRWFLTTYGNHEVIRKPAEKIIEIRNITSDKSLKPADKFEKITKLLRIKTKCKFEGDDTSTNKEIVLSIRDQIQALEDSQIYVGTVHSSKGLEYEAVYVMGVNDTMFKLGSEEMNNLAYVAFTRAKNYLTVFRT